MSEVENHYHFDQQVFSISESGIDLDKELYNSLVLMAQHENQQSDSNQSGQRMLIAAMAWFIAGLFIWALVGISI